MSTIDVDDLEDRNEQRRDFRRANGAPLVSDPADPSKTLRYSRPSSYAKCLDDEEALTAWRQNKIMEGVARSPALAAEINACKEDDKETRKLLREKALDKGAANESADMGTALHAMTARVEDRMDTAFDPPEQYQGDLAAYADAIGRYGLVSEMMEVPLVNDTFRAAGTADRIFRLTRRLQAPDGSWLEPGELVIGDLKTGKKLDFSLPGFTVQMALYADGVLYDIHNERRLPTPPINHDWTILVHLPVGKAHAKLWWCSIEVGLHGAWIASEVRKWRKEWKNGTLDATAIDEPPAIAEVLEAELGATVELDASMAVEMLGFCHARIQAIGANAQARQWLMQMWPPGLPTPKQGPRELHQIVLLLDYLDKVEAQFGMPFPGEDPRVALQRGLHHSKMDRSNEFAVTS